MAEYEPDILVKGLDVVFCGLNPAVSAAVAGDVHPSLVPLQLERGGGAVVAIASEQDLGRGEAIAVLRRHEGGGERELAAVHRQPLHVRVGRQERRPDVVQPALQRRRRGRQRCGVHEVLHRVGRHHAAVIPDRVGG